MHPSKAFIKSEKAESERAKDLRFQLKYLIGIYLPEVGCRVFGGGVIGGGVTDSITFSVIVADVILKDCLSGI